MNLAELLDDLVDEPSELDKNIEIKGIAIDSRKVKKDYVFIAIAGSVKHGLDYLQQALNNGAVAVIFENAESEEFGLDQQAIYQIAVNDLNLKLGKIAARFYHSPSKQIDVIGVTGTNGKTTCSQFLCQILPECGVIGTLGWGEKSALKKTINTTPDAVDVQEMLAEFVNLKKQTVVMEVSSHGLQQGRVNEVEFKGAVFTNLSRDHLDYHGSMEDYLDAKLVLFKQPNLEFVVVNADDPASKHFLAVANNNARPWVFSTTGNKNSFLENTVVEWVTAEKIDYQLNGIKFDVCWRNGKASVQTMIVGDFNLENILAVMTVLLALGYTLDAAAGKISGLESVKGRMEAFGGHQQQPFVIVDYAHTPDALKKVLLGVKKYSQQTLWLIFGCGGNRDKGKRVEMGAIAEQYADRVVITNDNPRFESPQQIIDDILAACLNKDTEVIQDRSQAIRTVIKNAAENDCIVIAGKGHEDYQEIKGVKHAFSDQEIVKQALQEWMNQS